MPGQGRGGDKFLHRFLSFVKEFEHYSEANGNSERSTRGVTDTSSLECGHPPKYTNNDLDKNTFRC